MFLQVCDKFFCHQVDQMESVAQGRVWSGQDAFSRGLVDSLGGVSQALTIAKQKANIPKDKKVSFS
jgi:protease IV